jgi:UDP-galactopyranose mutase
LVAAESKVYFAGRFAQYRYYNMDQVVGTDFALLAKQLCFAAD